MLTEMAKAGGPCWEPQPGGDLVCTRDPGHVGPHGDPFDHAEWPRLADPVTEPQPTQ